MHGTSASRFSTVLPFQNLLKQKNSLKEKKKYPRAKWKPSSLFTQDLGIGPSNVNQNFKISEWLGGDFGGCPNRSSPGTSPWLHGGCDHIQETRPARTRGNKSPPASWSPQVNEKTLLLFPPQLYVPGAKSLLMCFHEVEQHYGRTHTKNVGFSFWVRSKQLCNELINDPWKKNNTKLLNPCPEGCTHQLCRLIKAILFQEQPLRMGWWVSGCSSRSSYFTEMLSPRPGCGWQRFWGDTSVSRGWSSRRVAGGQQQFLK